MFDDPLRVIGDCPDVVGFDVAVSRCPLDIITALNPSPSGVSMIVPVAPTPCTTPSRSMTSRTRDGEVQPSPVALPALHSAA